MNYLEARLQPNLDFFGLNIQLFGLCLGAAFLVAGWMVANASKELGRNVDFAYEMVFAALIGGIIGAKLWYIAENGGPLFSGTGLVFYGGLIGGALAVLAWAATAASSTSTRRPRRRPRWPPPTRSAGSAASSRVTATTARTGTARGRWRIPRHGPDDTPVHPTPIYESS